MPLSFVLKPSRTEHISLDQISFSTFLAQQGTIFKALPESVPAVKLELIEVKEHQAIYAGAHIAADAGNEKFSLLFRGGDGPKLEQNTYVFEHDHLGRFSMFIVPLRAEDAGHNYYQAIFNRLPC